MTIELFPSSRSLTSLCPFPHQGSSHLCWVLPCPAGISPLWSVAGTPAGFGPEQCCGLCSLAPWIDLNLQLAVQPSQFLFPGKVVALVSSLSRRSSFFMAVSSLYTERLPRAGHECHTGVAGIPFHHQPGGQRYLTIYLLAYLFII